jgi:hypothetical protein
MKLKDFFFNVILISGITLTKKIKTTEQIFAIYLITSNITTLFLYIKNKQGKLFYYRLQY